MFHVGRFRLAGTLFKYVRSRRLHDIGGLGAKYADRLRTRAEQ
jgi:hypothetical protein